MLHYQNITHPDKFIQMELDTNGTYKYRKFTYLEYMEQDGSYVELYRFNSKEFRTVSPEEMQAILANYKLNSIH